MAFIMYIVPDTEFTASYVEHTMILHGAHGALYGGSIKPNMEFMTFFIHLTGQLFTFASTPIRNTEKCPV